VLQVCREWRRTMLDPSLWKAPVDSKTLTYLVQMCGSELLPCFYLTDEDVMLDGIMPLLPYITGCDLDLTFWRDPPSFSTLLRLAPHVKHVKLGIYIHLMDIPLPTEGRALETLHLTCLIMMPDGSESTLPHDQSYTVEKQFGKWLVSLPNLTHVTTSSDGCFTMGLTQMPPVLGLTRLQTLRLCYGTRNIIETILMQARDTLESLTVDNTATYHPKEHPRNLLQLIGQCPRLKTLDVPMFADFNTPLASVFLAGSVLESMTVHQGAPGTMMHFLRAIPMTVTLLRIHSLPHASRIYVEELLARKHLDYLNVVVGAPYFTLAHDTVETPWKEEDYKDWKLDRFGGAIEYIFEHKTRHKTLF